MALTIRDGRHPVVERDDAAGEFVPNDLDADPAAAQILIVTGPNMAGKSTLLRQVALIVILAQMGSFVPAGAARSGLTTASSRAWRRRRTGARRIDLHGRDARDGPHPAASTARSLIVLDEVGRGTSTFDGVAIAWAVAEYLHDSSRAKVLFATHFHELTELARERSRVKNLSMAVREWGGDVLFLRRVVEAAASRSYGIEVARLSRAAGQYRHAGAANSDNLEQGELDERGITRLARSSQGDDPAVQMNLFARSESRVIEELRSIEVDRLTPVDALNVLARLRARLRNDDD